MITDNSPELLSTSRTNALLERLSPGSALVSMNKLPGSFSNFTYLVDAQDRNGLDFRLVIRSYAVFGDYDRGEKARREYKTYEILQKHAIPAPKALFLDQTGEILGSPGIVTSYMPGKLDMSPSMPLKWAREMAKVLAQIHSVPYNPAEHDFLLDANQEASWFIHSGAVPDYMEAHPLGKQVWQTVHDLFPRLQKKQDCLVHVDYWPGNILWENDSISAIVDWEEAAFGDPAIDVAYCRMNMLLEDLPQAADEFIKTYERETGQEIGNLAFWELAAAARPMLDPEGWEIVESPRRDRFAQFIEQALAGCRWAQ